MRSPHSEDTWELGNTVTDLDKMLQGMVSRTKERENILTERTVKGDVGICMQSSRRTEHHGPKMIARKMLGIRRSPTALHGHARGVS